MASNRRFMAFLFKAVRYLIAKTRLVGTKNLPANTHMIIVANHLGSYGPITLMSSLTFDIHPWVIHKVTRIDTCPSYLREDFIETELKLKGPLSITFSVVIGRICVALLRGINAIPVYRKSRNMRKTIELSLHFLRERKALLIFPEIKGQPLVEGIERFDSGFIVLGKHFYRLYGKCVAFVPAAVNKKARAISIGDPVYFRPETAYHRERDRIRDILEQAVVDMYQELNEQARQARQQRETKHKKRRQKKKAEQQREGCPIETGKVFWPTGQGPF